MRNDEQVERPPYCSYCSSFRMPRWEGTLLVCSECDTVLEPEAVKFSSQKNTLKVPFAKTEITPQEEEAVLRVLRSGWLTSGPEMLEFEKELSQYLGDERWQSIAVSSATAGLHLALEAIGVGRGDSVLLPTWTFTATAEVVTHLRATPIFVDIDPLTMNIDIEDAKRKMRSDTVAIIPVHFAGLPCNMNQIWNFANQFGLKVVEDAAHALGAWYDGVKIGIGRSDAVVFSFYATKCITTAEGGAVVTRNRILADRMRLMRSHGIDRQAFDRYTTSPGSWEYDVIAPGFKYNMPDVLAALGREQLKRIDQMYHQRQSIAIRYFELLKVDKPVWQGLFRGVWHLFVIRVMNRKAFIERMAEAGVGCSVHFKPLHQMTYWKPYSLSGICPVADELFKTVVSIPIYSSMTDEDVNAVIQAVNHAAIG